MYGQIFRTALTLKAPLSKTSKSFNWCSGSIQQCAFFCHGSRQCEGFSYNLKEQICTLKTSFSLSDIHPANDVISGSKELCQPWMTVYRHDSIDKQNPLCSVMFEEDFFDPNLIFYNLDVLKFLRDPEDDSIEFNLAYPRTVNFDYFIWKQTSNPMSEELVEDFELRHQSSQ